MKVELDMTLDALMTAVNKFRESFGVDRGRLVIPFRSEAIARASLSTGQQVRYSAPTASIARIGDPIRLSADKQICRLARASWSQLVASAVVHFSLQYIWQNRTSVTPSTPTVENRGQ